MKRVANKYRPYVTNKRFMIAFCVGALLLISSLVLNFYAGIYATEKVSSSVTDIVLDNIPVFDVDMVFIYGPWALWLIVTGLLLREPKKIPFTLKSIALFVFIRSIFITLTHIGPFPDAITVNYASELVKRFTFGGDLFFSAHTGLPFLMALIFSENRYLKWFFILLAIFFGVIVLLGHLHYSIDVLAAFFITYSIYAMAKVLFKNDLNHQ